MRSCQNVCRVSTRKATGSVTSSEFEARIEEASKRTLVNASAVNKLIAHARQFMEAPGDVVECGSYRGGAAMLYAACADYFYPQHGKMVYAFDTFSGFPEVGPQDEKEKSEFSDVQFEEVLEATKHIKNLVLVRGKFEDTFPSFAPRPISIAAIDCDLYRSYLDCLNKFWPMVSPRGICLVLDYSGIRGATQAVREFFGNEIERVVSRKGIWGITKEA